MKISVKPLLVILSSIVSLTTPLSALADINVGVLAPRGELKAMKRWQAFGDYLSQQLDEKIVIVPLAPPKVLPAAKQGKVDFVLSNPVHSLKLSETAGASLLATLNKKSGSQFAGVIVSKKGSGIRTSEDLRNKKVMSLKFRSAAGAYVFQTYHLNTKGIDPHKDFASIKAGKKQDDLILAVKAGLIDAAFVRTGILEAMDKEGKINKNNFNIVDQRNNDGMALLHSTKLYPEWYLLAMPTVEKSQAKKIQTAALNLTTQNTAASKANIKGFVKALPLDGMKTAFKALGIAPYNQ